MDFVIILHAQTLQTEVSGMLLSVVLWAAAKSLFNWPKSVCTLANWLFSTMPN